MIAVIPLRRKRVVVTNPHNEVIHSPDGSGYYATNHCPMVVTYHRWEWLGRSTREKRSMTERYATNEEISARDSGVGGVS
jgi:hypothetical protein